MSMLLITSDPLINSLREVPKKKSGKLPPEVLNLIVAPSVVARSEIINIPPNEDDYFILDSSEDSGDDE